MQKNEENIILFPTWRMRLEKESLQALKDKRFAEALYKLDKLLSYQVNNHEILIGKLICLMELGRYEEAQDLSEELLELHNDNYYHYVHIYLTILFQTNQYDVLMEQVEYELESEEIPLSIEEQFIQLYNMSEQMNIDLLKEKSTEYIIELAEAVNDRNYIRQWQLVENLRKMKVDPTETIIQYLVDENIHPVIKTTIFKWLQDKQMGIPIDVHKFNLDLTVKPNAIKSIRQHKLMKQVMFFISELEQENPTLFILLEQLLYRFAYVRFPIMPPSEDVINIASAVQNLGEQYLHIEAGKEIHKNVLAYMEEIKMCESLYLSVIEE